MVMEEDNVINVLVVGDWIIDEDWVVTQERSETSSKQHKEKHYHTAFNKVDVPTNRLCGASLTASAIRGFLKKNEKGCGDFSIYGMGVWHPGDNELLEILFEKNKLEGVNPFRLNVVANRKNKPKKKLFNLACKGETCATTRIVRTFLGHPGTNIESMSRYDWHLNWEPNLKNGQNKGDLIDKRIEDCFSEINKKFDAIVLADFNKGLIDDDLIDSLTKRVRKYKSQKGIIWFYRSKRVDTPDWYNIFCRQIEPQDTLIRFIDPILSKKYTSGKTLTCGSELTPEGIDFLSEYKNIPIKNSKLAVLFHDNTGIAHDSNSDDIWVLCSNEKPSYITRGRSSIFLASLVITELAKIKKSLFEQQSKSFGEDCAIALANGVKWCNDCLGIWKKEKKIMEVAADITGAIYHTKPDSKINISKPKKLEGINREWNQARNKENACCISSGNRKEEYRLEVWRAHTTLNNLTVLDANRSKSIFNLNNTIQAFMEMEDKDKPRPLISLVKADPGSGKTFLAKCLAQEFGLELFECNVAQLTSLDGLVNFFDQVDIAQRDGINPFVFLDEVDTLVNGESAFGFLLELMWCGRYYRNGLKNTLKPFPGLFAMSRDPKSDSTFNKQHPKFKDLKSRIFGIYCELEDMKHEESIYLFANLLRKYYGEVAHVEKGVLKIIGNTEFKYGPRSIELLISLLKGVKRDKITFDNLPLEERVNNLKEHFPKGLYEIKTYGNDEKKMVELIYTPPDLFEQ